jgi:hypothetical protein
MCRLAGGVGLAGLPCQIHLSLSEIRSWHVDEKCVILYLVGHVLKLFWSAFVGLFRSRASREAEIVVLRHQLNILKRQSPKRPMFTNFDRLIFVVLYRLAPGILDTLAIVKPETVIGWHRAGFRLFWRLKSRDPAGRPKVPSEIRKLIYEMSCENPLWGAPRIHGELLKLGIDVGQTSVAKYIIRRSTPPSQGWKTFVGNRFDGPVRRFFRLLYS